MKKILILTDQFYEHGGIEKLIAAKANYWSTYFHYNISIICTENKENPSVYRLESSIKILDFEIDYNRSKSYFSTKNILLLLKNIIKLQMYIISKKPNYIIVASHIPMTYVLPFLKLGNTKLVKEFHFTQYNRRYTKGIKNYIFNSIESKYHKLIALSPEEGSFYCSKNVEVIPNPTKKSFAIKKKFNKKNIASSVVRFVPVKRLELMIEVWQKFISYGNQDWKLYIYGDYNNEYGAKILKLAKDLNVSDYIVFKGQADNVEEEIAKSKVFLLTSSQECFPMVILEAQSVGVPVISFDCPTGPRNIIHDKKDGILIENNNVLLFSEALQAFASDEEMQDRLSKNALVNADKYTIEKVMSIWKEKVFI